MQFINIFLVAFVLLATSAVSFAGLPAPEYWDDWYGYRPYYRNNKYRPSIDY